MPFDETLVRAIGTRSAKTLESYVRELSRAWSLPSLEREITFTLNTRLRTCVARYRPNLNSIEVGRSFLRSPRLRREALGHELAHAAVAARYNNKAQAHGEEWRAHMRQVGLEPRSKIDVTPGVESMSIRRPRTRVQHLCPVCQMTRYSSRPVPGWRCRNCHLAGLSGELEITTMSHG